MYRARVGICPPVRPIQHRVAILQNGCDQSESEVAITRYAQSDSDHNMATGSTAGVASIARKPRRKTAVRFGTSFPANAIASMWWALRAVATSVRLFSSPLLLRVEGFFLRMVFDRPFTIGS
jgi:hypothetical protein